MIKKKYPSLVILCNIYFKHISTCSIISQHNLIKINVLYTPPPIKPIIKCRTDSELPWGLLSGSGLLSECRNSSDTVQTSPVTHKYRRNEVPQQLLHPLEHLKVSRAHPSLDGHRCHVLKNHILNFTAGRDGSDFWRKQWHLPSFLWLSSNLNIAISFMMDFTACFTRIPHSEHFQLQHYADFKAFFYKIANYHQVTSC